MSMANPARTRLNFGLRDAQSVCTLTKVGTVLKLAETLVLKLTSTSALSRTALLPLCANT